MFGHNNQKTKILNLSNEGEFFVEFRRNERFKKVIIIFNNYIYVGLIIHPPGLHYIILPFIYIIIVLLDIGSIVVLLLTTPPGPPPTDSSPPHI